MNFEYIKICIRTRSRDNTESKFYYEENSCLVNNLYAKTFL